MGPDGSPDWGNLNGLWPQFTNRVYLMHEPPAHQVFQFNSIPNVQGVRQTRGFYRYIKELELFLTRLQKILRMYTKMILNKRLVSIQSSVCPTQSAVIPAQNALGQQGGKCHCVCTTRMQE